MAKTGKISCAKCPMCGPKIKKVLDGKTVDMGPLDPRGNRTVKYKDSDNKEQSRTCPEPFVKPFDAPVIDVTERGKAEQAKVEQEEAKKEEVRETPMPAFVDYGYGPSCEKCHATRGECHGIDCPARKHVGESPIT